MISMVAAALLTAGCGEELPRTVDVAVLGDSITAGTGVPPSERFTTFAARETGLTFRTCGIFGQRAEEIADRLDECSAGARVLIIQGGINDLARRYEPAVAADALRAMVRRGKAAGRQVMLTDVLPWNNGYPVAAGAIRELNDLIGTIAEEEGVERLEFFAAIEDPAAPDRMKPEWTVDGDHPSAAGHRRLAAVVARATSGA